jgi:hypothetical protein
LQLASEEELETAMDWQLGEVFVCFFHVAAAMLALLPARYFSPLPSHCTNLVVGSLVAVVAYF